jgi:hypothetical protein
MAVAARDAEELAPCTFAPQLVGMPPPAPPRSSARLRGSGLTRSSAPSGVAWHARPASAPHRASAPPRFMDDTRATGGSGEVAAAAAVDEAAAAALPRRFEALTFDLSEALAVRRGARTPAAGASPGDDEERAFEQRALAAAARVRARLSQS